jgi:putative ABC transport system substrate-binding protein
VELGQKHLEVLTELVPAATVIALLVNPANPSNADTLSRDLQAAARIRGVGLHVLHASTKATSTRYSRPCPDWGPARW